MREILFLPLDATLDGLLKGPTGVRPPPGMRAPSGSKGPPGQQPKLGASGMGGKPPAPKGPSVGGAGPGGGNGKQYNYIKADKPPPGNAGRTPGGYWKVPVGASAGKQMSPDNLTQESPDKKRDPLSGQSVSKVDENVSKIHAETQAKPDPLADTQSIKKPESGPAKYSREKKEARKTAEEGTAARNSMKDEDFKYEPKLEGEGTGEVQQPGAEKTKKTQSFDMYSNDEKSFEGAHPAAHYALADKFRKEGDAKMAHFHEEQAAKKTEGFGHAEHAELSDMLGKYGLHKDAAKHGSKSSAMKAAEMKRDPNWERAAETDDVMYPTDDEMSDETPPSEQDVTSDDDNADPIHGQKAADVGDESAQDPIHGQQASDVGKKPKNPHGPNGERFDLEPGSPEHAASIKQGTDEKWGDFRSRVKREHGIEHPEVNNGYYHADNGGYFNGKGKAAAALKEKQTQSSAEFEAKRKAHNESQSSAPADEGQADPIHGETVENLGQPERASGKTKQALSDHKESGGKKSKELADKHSAGEKELTDKHKQTAADLATSHEEKGRKMAEGHAARENELTTRHKDREKELSAKHEASGKELAAKHGEEHKEHTQNHRDAQDEHVKAQARLKSVRGSAKPDKEKVKSAQRDVDAAKELITESKRKLDDHKVKAKSQMDAHKESSAKEMAAHQDRAAVIGAHKKKASEEMAAHKAKGKADAVTHKQTSEKEVSDHKAASKKELDSHNAEHGAKGKELGQQHEAAAKSDEVQDKQAKVDSKAKDQQAKQDAKAQGKSEAEKAANVRRAPGDDQEKLKAQGHSDKARKMQDNIQTHLDDPNIDPARRETLHQAHQMLQEHVDGGHVPTPEMEQQIKDVEKAAGEHGKKASENASEKPDKASSGGSTKKAPGIGATMANAYNQGAAAGDAIGAAAASPYSGALGRATLHYGAKGVASGGHYLLSPPAGKSDSEKATAAVASERHEQSKDKNSSSTESDDKSTETVSAKKHVAKGLRLYVKAGWQL